MVENYNENINRTSILFSKVCWKLCNSCVSYIYLYMNMYIYSTEFVLPCKSVYVVTIILLESQEGWTQIKFLLNFKHFMIQRF